CVVRDHQLYRKERCLSCHRYIRLFSKGRCRSCYKKSQPHIICACCGEERPTVSARSVLCARCSEAEFKFPEGPCRLCGVLNGWINRRGFCVACGARGRPGRRCIICNRERPIAAFNRCPNCYHNTDHYLNSQISTLRQQLKRECGRNLVTEFATLERGRR